MTLHLVPADIAVVGDRGKLKLDRDGIRLLCEFLETGPSLRAAAKAVGISEGTIHSMVNLSRDNDPRTLVDYPKGTPDRQLWEAMTSARRASLIAIEANVRDQVLNGVPEILRGSDGQIIYEKDPEANPVDVELGLSDGWLRDADGKKVPVIIRKAAPAHLTIKVLSACVPGYADQKQVSINHNVTGGNRNIIQGSVPGQDRERVEAMKQILTADTVSLIPPKENPDWLANQAAKVEDAEPQRFVKAPVVSELRRLLQMTPADRAAAMGSPEVKAQLAEATQPVRVAEPTIGDTDPDDGERDPRNADGSLR